MFVDPPGAGDDQAMIKLTRLGGQQFILNAELIRYVEACPDTFITLTTGERVVVAESMDEVLRRAVAYQQAKHLLPAPAWPPAHRAQPVLCRACGQAVVDRPAAAADMPAYGAARVQPGIDPRGPDGSHLEHDRPGTQLETTAAGSRRPGQRLQNNAGQ